MLELNFDDCTNRNALSTTFLTENIFVHYYDVQHNCR